MKFVSHLKNHHQHPMNAVAAMSRPFCKWKDVNHETFDLKQNFDIFAVDKPQIMQMKIFINSECNTEKNTRVEF